MRTFRLTDTDFAALAAGRPSAATLDDLRKAQQSRHLLLLSEIFPYAETPADLADPMAALHTAAMLAALRAGAEPPPDRVVATRHLTATHDGLTLRLRLEDTDPLRARLGLTPSGRLSDAEAARWQSHLDEAWQILTTRHREVAATMAAVLSVLIPIEPDPASGGMSATSADAFGAVAISPAADGRALAVGLLHETQHSLLNATRTLFDLVTSSRPAYSPWRDDPRPPFGILHGAYAYQAVTRFWRTEAAHLRRLATPGVGTGVSPSRADKSGVGGKSGESERTVPAERHLDAERRLAEFEFARWRTAVVEAADALLRLDGEPPTGRGGTEHHNTEHHDTEHHNTEHGGEGVLTAAGRRFAEAMRDEVASWLDEAVDDDVARLATGANAEHRAGWRLRNLVVAPESVADVVAAWHKGERPPAAPAPAIREDHGRALARSERLRLVHRVLRDPAAGQDAGDADRAYLRGDHETAFTAYREDWVSLAVVSPYRMLRERPELVKAVHEALTPRVDLHRLAAWLDG